MTFTIRRLILALALVTTACGGDTQNAVPENDSGTRPDGGGSDPTLDPLALEDPNLEDEVTLGETDPAAIANDDFVDETAPVDEAEYSPAALDPPPAADDIAVIPTPSDEQDPHARISTRARQDMPIDGKIAIKTRTMRRVGGGFNGMNQADLRYAISWKDTRYRALVNQLQPGWLRFPAGTASDVFDWQTGQVRDGWIDDNRFDGDHRQAFRESNNILRARGGAQLADFVSMTRGANAGIIICLNTFTDNPASARDLARWVKNRGIDVIAWELGNEPHFFPSFYSNGAAYARDVRPYAQAIRDILPNAKITVAYSFAGFGKGRQEGWDQSLAGEGRYWNGASVHVYPKIAEGDFDKSVNILNHALVRSTRPYISWLKGINPAGTDVFVTEMNAGLGGPVVATMYGGIFAVEYAMRMSQLNTVKRVGLHVLYSGNNNSGAIQAREDHNTAVAQAGANGQMVDTTTLDFGLYVTAQGAAVQVANGAFRRARNVLETRIVSRDNVDARDDEEGGGTRRLRSMYAQTYAKSGNRTILVTNKGRRPHRMSVTLDGRRVRGQFRVTFAQSDDPQERNAPTRDRVFPEVTMENDSVTIPPYSVVRIDF